MLTQVIWPVGLTVLWCLAVSAAFYLARRALSRDSIIDETYLTRVKDVASFLRHVRVSDRSEDLGWLNEVAQETPELGAMTVEGLSKRRAAELMFLAIMGRALILIAAGGALLVFNARIAPVQGIEALREGGADAVAMRALSRIVCAGGGGAIFCYFARHLLAKEHKRRLKGRNYLLRSLSNLE